MSALADYRMLWLAAVNQRQPGLVSRSYFIIPACMLVVGGLWGALTHDWVTALFYSVDLALVALAVYFATIFVPGAALLNTPANARLVPRARRRLMQMTALGWLAIVLVPALALGSSIQAMLLLFVAVGLCLVGLGLAQGGYAVGAFIPVMVPMSASTIRRLLGGPVSLVLLLAAALALLACAALVLQLIFPRGGDRHWTVRGKVLRAAERATGEGQFNTAPSWRPGAGFYAATLRRDCARRNASALLLHVLGPTAHWTQLLLTLVWVVALAVVTKMLLGLYADIDSLHPLARIAVAACIITLMLLQVFNIERLAARLSATRVEQALLRMTPLTTPARQFNRQLGHALLRYALLNWGVFSLAVMSVSLLSGASARTLIMQASLCCLGLPLVAALLRDHARRAGIMGWRLVLAILAAALVSVVAGLQAARLGMPGWAVMALTSAAIAALAVSWRWRAMVAAPVAFPVGRLA